MGGSGTYAISTPCAYPDPFMAVLFVITPMGLISYHQLTVRSVSFHVSSIEHSGPGQAGASLLPRINGH